MKAMTLWQPWATAVALGIKRVETRPAWVTQLRAHEGERIAIHAAARLPGPAYIGDWRVCALDRLRPRDVTLSLYGSPGPGQYRGLHSVHPLPLGAIVATAVVGPIIPTGNVRWPPSQANPVPASGTTFRETGWGPLLLAIDPAEAAWGDYGPGRYAFPLLDVVALEQPIPAVGRQRLWTVPPALVGEWAA